MRYRIIRRGVTVAIGHCKDSDLITDVQIGRTVDEIDRRLKPHKYHDSGVTYRSDEFLALSPGDVISINTERETLTLQIHRDMILSLIDRRSIPLEIADTYID